MLAILRGNPGGHAGSVVDLTLDFEGTAVLLEDVPRGGETEARARKILTRRVAAPEESFRRLGDLSGRNADPLIADLDRDLLWLDLQPQLDDAAARGEFHGVGEQAPETLPPAPPVTHPG